VFLLLGNHALYAGTRVLYGLSVTRQGPRIFTWTTRAGVPLPALFATSSISLLCFGSSFIGSGQLWGWLQNIVGVSNQVRRCQRNVKEILCLGGCYRLLGSLLDLPVGDLGRLGSGKAEA
jgi:amino acid permease